MGRLMMANASKPMDEYEHKRQMVVDLNKP